MLPSSSGDSFVFHEEEPERGCQNRYKAFELANSDELCENWIGIDALDGVQVHITIFRENLKRKLMLKLLSELNAFQKLSHPLIQKILSISQGPPFSYVSQYYPYGTLFSYLHSGRRESQLSPTARTAICQSLAHTLAFLHQNGVFLGGISSQALYLNEELLPIISLPLSSDQSVEADISGFSSIVRDLMESRPMHNTNLYGSKSLGALLQKCSSDTPPQLSAIYKSFSSGEIMFEGTDLKRIYDISDMLSTLNATDSFEKLPFRIRTQNCIKTEKTSDRYIDCDVVADPSSLNFRSELKKASRFLMKTQSRRFFSSICGFFTSPIPSPEMKAVLACVSNLVKNHTHRETFNSMKIELPIDNPDLFDECLDILRVLFEKSPSQFSGDFKPKMAKILRDSPSKAMVLIALYSKGFQSIEDPYQLLDIIFEKTEEIFKYQIEKEAISILYFLCSSFPEFKTNRSSECRSFFLRGLESDVPCSITMCFNALSSNFRKADGLDLKRISSHLENPETAAAALSFIVRVDKIPLDTILIRTILKSCFIHKEATMAILRIVSYEEAANSIISTTSWISQAMPTYLDTFRLFLGLMIHSQLRKKLGSLEETYQLFEKLSALSDPRIFSCISSVFSRFNIDKELVQKLGESGALRGIIKASLKVGGKSAVHAAFNIGVTIAKAGFASELLILAKPLKEVMLSQSELSGYAAMVITILSKYPLCAKKFKDLNLEKYFRKLLNNDDYREYSSEFLKNLSATEFY